jgi:hypothetical protein
MEASPEPGFEPAPVRPLPGPAGSLLDVIRERRDAVAAERTYDMPVPGFGGLLVLRCGPVPAETMTAARDRFARSRDPAKNFGFAADILIRVCQEVLARATRAEELRSPDPTGETLRLDEHFAELFRLDARSGREVVRWLFGNAPSPELALDMAMQAYFEWAQGADDDADEDLLGE